MRLTVMSYNIKSGQWTPDGLAAIARVIEDVRPDIVALQEVDRHLSRTGAVDQAAWLGDRLGYEAVFGSAMDARAWGQASGEYGLAILSRRSILASERRLLFRPDSAPGQPLTGAAEQRIMLACAVDHAGTPINVICTHFGLTAEQRLVQAREVAAFATSWHAERPVVLMGDFNAVPESPEIATLRAALADVFDDHQVTGDARLTFPSGPLGSRTDDGWSGAIDYVFVSSHFHSVGIDVIRETGPASDHAPVVAMLELPA